MSSHLYFVCPTDKLEGVINETFKSKNYFLTSLGNSVLFDDNLIGELNNFIEAKKVKQITFVLSHDNKIVIDAIANQEFSSIKGLQKFYNDIELEKRFSIKNWKMNNIQVPIIESYLNEKMVDLGLKLHDWLPVKLDTKIYNNTHKTFREANYNLIYEEYLCLN